MDSIAQISRSLETEMIKFRRFFHSHPESGWFTYFTTCTIAYELEKLGFSLIMGKDAITPKDQMGVGSLEDHEIAKDRARKLLNDEQKNI